MSWKKYFKTANPAGTVSPIGSNPSGGQPAYRNYQSNLPEIYIGHPNRVERYNQYEQMDMDSEVNAALDILAEFSTQPNIETNMPFEINYKEKPTDSEVKIIKEQLQQWVTLNEFKKRIFKIMRNTLKYGDQVFVRDPENFKLSWVEMSKVVKVIVNEAEGKEPEQYIIKDLQPNFQNLTVTAVSTSDTYANHPQVGGPSGSYTQPRAPYSGGNRFSHAQNESVINAEHVVHLSLTEGLDLFWPFGNSVLENVFKVFKQKELLEDSIIIYRVQRAPERRVFKIDVGNMPSHMAMAFVERIKNEIAQRRIPTQTGAGTNMMDATYNPMSVNEDFFFPTTAEGRGSSVDILPGGCLAMDTLVPLLDGRTLTLNEMTAEYKAGKVNWVYSTNPGTGEIVPGIVSWAGVTQASAKVLKITLDNGESITCTPDHKFPIISKGQIRADELEIGESLIAFNSRNTQLSKNSDYNEIYQNHTKQWEFVHSMVNKNITLSEKVHDERFCDNCKDITNHVDHNSFDNAAKEAINHKVVLIEVLDEPIQVGTLTIDVDEKYHAYHNFALSVGVFTQNSNLGEITDLRFFTNKLFRGLRIPSSYLPTGMDDGTQSVSDGRVGTALIQEWRFNQYCLRLQRMVVDKLDQEFKMFMRWRGLNIDGQLFDLVFNEPQNFANYRQAEIDTARIGTFTQLEGFPYFSKRFLMKRYLGMSEQEMSENEMMWMEEKGEAEETQAADVGLRSVGVTPGGLDADMSAIDVPDLGAEGAPGAVPPAPGGAPTPAAGPAAPAPSAPAGNI